MTIVGPVPQFADRESLSRVTQADARIIGAWGEGVHLEARTNRSIEELIHRASADRLALAYQLRRRANKLLEVQPSMQRDAVSRYYYAMYHAARALAFFRYQGDDHQEHTKLPDALPGDFLDRDTWVNNLKNARLARNEADYSPYPKSDHAWDRQALGLRSQAGEFLRLSRAYLRSKGCSYI